MALFITNQDNLALQLQLSGVKGVVDRFSGYEELFGLYEFCIDFHSTNSTIDLDGLIKKDATLTFKDTNPTSRYFSGIVVKASQGMTIPIGDTKHTHYTIVIRPLLWTLETSANCKIYQNKTALDIIQNVLKEQGINDLDVKVTKSGKKSREYCVQYNETDLAFIRRLMWEEGIFFYFKHGDQTHQLILSDDSLSATDLITKDVEMIHTNNMMSEPNRIYNLFASHSLVSKKFASRDFDEEKPSQIPSTTQSGSSKGGEFYFYPGLFKDDSGGNEVGKRRLEEIEWVKSTISGSSTAALMMPGFKFKLAKHDRQDLNKEYTIFRVEHSLSQHTSADKTGSATKMDGYLYENKFVAFPNSIPFRANEPIPKPKIYGNQTAIVTVKEGEEIWCDDARRIKVKFHWDRAQEKDENSSCWIRVAQIWSGSTWGGLFTPRKDMEVVVTFLDGDPDRPLIVGCVYNGDNKPPYDNNDATKNGIKSRSSKEDEGFNELRFEDKKGEEEVYIHAQKDMNEYIIHSQTTTLQTGSRTVKILAEKDDDGDDTLEMTRGTKLIHITEGDFNTNLDKGNQSTTLTQGDQTTTLSQGNREITLSQGNQTVTLSSGHYTLTLSSGNLTIDITGSVTVKSTQDMAFESSTGKMSFKALSGFDFSTSAGDFNVSHCLNFKAKADIAAEVQSSVTAKLQSAIVQIKADALADINGGAIVKAGPMVKIG